jgi:thiol-disulfide isomerase/thioredoxin
MKKIFRCLLIIIPLVAATSANAQSVNWLKDFDEAKQMAKETGKPILLDFTASWCKPCQEMEKTFWVRTDVIELTKDFIAVKVNYDNERGLAEKYYVSSIPNVTITDPWGNWLNYTRGFGSNTDVEILNQLQSVPKDFSPIAKETSDIETDKNNVEALIKLAEFYNQHKFYSQSNEFSKRILKLETDPLKRENLLINIGFNYIRSSEPNEAEEFLEDFQKEFPNSKTNEVAFYGLVFVNIQKNKLKSAGKILEKFKTEYPESKYISQLEEEIVKAKQKK